MSARVRSVLVVLLLGLTGCSSVSAPGEAAAPVVSTAATLSGGGAGGSVPVVTLHSDQVAVFSSIADLVDVADVAVQGVVSAATSFSARENTFTKVHLRVERSWLAELPVGSEITVVLLGGESTVGTLMRQSGRPLATPPTAAQEGAKVIVSDEGAPATVVGQQVTMFLSRGQIHLIEGEYFVPIGSYQGVFRRQGQGVARFLPDEVPQSAVRVVSATTLPEAITAAANARGPRPKPFPSGNP